MSNRGVFFNVNSEVFSKPFNLNAQEREEGQNAEMVETERKFDYH